MSAAPLKNPKVNHRRGIDSKTPTPALVNTPIYQRVAKQDWGRGGPVAVSVDNARASQVSSHRDTSALDSSPENPVANSKVPSRSTFDWNEKGGSRRAQRRVGTRY